MKKTLACILLGCLPSFGWDAGFDFRATQSYVTDPSYAVFASHNYPTTLNVNGQPVTFGWESKSASFLTQDRVLGIDTRMAGTNCQQNDGTTSVFRVDLPSTGTYSIGLASGDPAGYTLSNNITISSGTSSVLSIHATTGATSIPDMADATGVLWGLSAWPGSNVMVQKTFGSTILRMTLGGTVDGLYSCVNHLRITSVAVSAAPSAAGMSFFIL